MVVAGALEDHFATSSLAERMPTLIRRFVNRFRRSRQVTSFETLESTMTVHGALKLLGLSTQAGIPVTLSSIREAYKQRALEKNIPIRVVPPMRCGDSMRPIGCCVSCTGIADQSSWLRLFMRPESSLA